MAAAVKIGASLTGAAIFMVAVLGSGSAACAAAGALAGKTAGAAGKTAGAAASEADA